MEEGYYWIAVMGDLLRKELERKKSEYTFTFKELKAMYEEREQMKDLKMPSKEQVLDCASTCDEVEAAMRKLFPEAFEEEWEIISNDLELEIEDTSDGWAFWKIAHKGTQIFRIDEKGIDNYRPDRIKIDYNNQAIKVTMKKPIK